MATYTGKRRRPEPTLKDVLEGRYRIPEYQKIAAVLAVVMFLLSLAMLVGHGV